MQATMRFCARCTCVPCEQLALALGSLQFGLNHSDQLPLQRLEALSALGLGTRGQG